MRKSSSPRIPEHVQVSVILEWENVLSTELERCQEMLRRLTQQAEELQSLGLPERLQADKRFLASIQFPVELLVVFDDRELREQEIRDTVEREIRSGGRSLALRMLPASGQTYTELKRTGAANTVADLVLFIDSDVIPAEGWMMELLRPFEDPRVQVVAGYTCIDATDFYSRVYSLTTLYDLPGEAPSLGVTSYFFGNNIAFRRWVLEEHPLPSLPGSARISAALYVETLNAKGIQVHRNSAAKTTHPPPLRKNFLKRSFTQGVEDRRQKMYQAREGISSDSPFQSSGYSPIEFWVKGLTRLGNLIRHRSRVGLKAVEIPFGMAMMMAFYASFAIGYLIADWVPARPKSDFTK